MSRGFVFSIDAVVSAIAAFIIIASIFSLLSGVGFSSATELSVKEYGADVLAVLEKNNDLEKAVLDDSPNDIRKYLNKLPDTHCIEILIYDSNSNIVMSIVPGGCKKQSGDVYVMFRSFVVQNGNDFSFYYAKSSAWVRTQ